MTFEEYHWPYADVLQLEASLQDTSLKLRELRELILGSTWGESHTTGWNVAIILPFLYWELLSKCIGAKVNFFQLREVLQTFWPTEPPPLLLIVLNTLLPFGLSLEKHQRFGDLAFLGWRLHAWVLLARKLPKFSTLGPPVAIWSYKVLMNPFNQCKKEWGGGGGWT